MKFLTKTGQECSSNATEEMITVPHAKCINGKVRCPEDSEFGGEDEEVYRCWSDLTCDSDKQCPPGMKCSDDETCICNADGHTFDWSIQQCMPRDFEDSCKNDADCSAAPEMSHLKGYSPAGTGVCKENKCQCPEDLKPVKMGFIDSKSRAFVQKTVCLPKKAKTGIENGTCHIDPFKVGNTTQVEVCQETSICYSCASDKLQANVGHCRMFPHCPHF